MPRSSWSPRDRQAPVGDHRRRRRARPEWSSSPAQPHEFASGHRWDRRRPGALRCPEGRSWSSGERASPRRRRRALSRSSGTCFRAVRVGSSPRDRLGRVPRGTQVAVNMRVERADGPFDGHEIHGRHGDLPGRPPSSPSCSTWNSMTREQLAVDALRRPPVAPPCSMPSRTLLSSGGLTTSQRTTAAHGPPRPSGRVAGGLQLDRSTSVPLSPDPSAPPSALLHQGARAFHVEHRCRPPHCWTCAETD